MIDFYSAETPNVRKVTLMLEECGLKYHSIPVDLKKNEQKKPDYLSINPNGRVPAIVDHEGPFGQKTPVFESGAILIYLAEKTGKFYGSTALDRAKILPWVMFQMSAVGPNFGNYHYGLTYMEVKTPAFIERFRKESLRIISVLNDQLTSHTYLAGDFYSIADICTFHWVAAFLKNHPDLFEQAPSVRRWVKLLCERPAVQKIGF